jgi:hypothetical protein
MKTIAPFASLVVLVAACDASSPIAPALSRSTGRESLEVALCDPATLICPPSDSTPAPRDSTYVCYLMFDPATGYSEWCGWVIAP